jgi:hypothetical protein
MKDTDVPIGTVVCFGCDVPVVRAYWRGGRRKYEYAAPIPEATYGTGPMPPTITTHKAWSGAWDVEDDLDGAEGTWFEVECKCRRANLELGRVVTALAGRRRVSLADVS